MELNELIENVISYTESPEAEQVLTTAFQIAVNAHLGYRRISGESYVNHALAVASILARWHAPLTVITVGLLHDIRNPDYSHGYSLDNVRSRLGTDTFQLLEAMISLNRFMRQVEGDFDSGIDDSDIHQQHMHSFLRQEYNAVVIKIADRLHNMWTISTLNRYFQERTARIGLSLLAPLADRLGMGAIKRQLEDVCFEILYPMYYNMLRQHYMDASIDQEVKGILEELQQVSNSLTLKSEVRRQSASLYSLYLHQIEQNTRQGKSIHAELPPVRIVDAGSFVILTDDEIDCYRILGALHKLYPPVERQFRDFIGRPKENGYRALHTQVRHTSGHFLHMMIRTHTMDLVAEHGMTAHWWNVPEEFLPLLPEDIKPVEEEIQVFTPNGEIKYFPQGATVLDFAYDIHTDVGHRCVGALVNGERADLSRVLRTGDRIEIISGGPDARPRLDWLDLARTPRAISRIRQWLTQHRRNQMWELGHALLDKELKPLGLGSGDAQVHQLLTKLALKENLAGTEDLLVSIGVGRHKTPQLVEQLKSMRLKSIRSHYSEPTASVIVLSPEEALLPHTLAQCCKPTPPEDIVGYRRTDNTLAIHKRDCSQIKEREKLIQVKWDGTSMEPNYVVVVEALNRPGLASDLSTVIAFLGFDMVSFSASKRSDGVMAESHIYLGKTTSVQRSRIQKALEDVPYVTKAEVMPSSFLLTAMQQAESSKPIYQANPYGPTIAAGARFYGREVESQRISALLHDQSQNTAILLWGQKRIGKTSFVLRLEEQSRGDFLPIYVDVQGLRDGSTTQFLHQLMMTISRVLKDNTQDSGEKVNVPALNRLRKDPLSYFDMFMAQVQEEARSYPLVVILDEFQCLCSLREEGVSRGAIFSRLRSHAQHGYGIHFILSGGGLLNQLTGQCDIALLFNIAHYEKLGCLEANAARRLIRDGLTRVGNITENAVELLLDFTAGHPFYLQLLCSMLYDQAQENKTIITSDAASLSTREWLGRSDASRFQHLWEGHNTATAQRNKLILSAIAQLAANNHEVEYDRLAGVVCSIVAEQDLVRSLEDLADLGVLEHNHANYAIKVELFAHWLRQHWPLGLTLKEASWL
jgi:guanosine-3',5'-bis(diphosphate) 3'-pyrophosphohydrolase